MYVSPEHLGSKIFDKKDAMEDFLGKSLKAVDECGVVLGDEFIKVWPRWLPKDWRIAYIRKGPSVKPCFLGPNGVVYSDKKAVLCWTEKETKKKRAGGCDEQVH